MAPRAEPGIREVTVLVAQGGIGVRVFFRRSGRF